MPRSKKRSLQTTLNVNGRLVEAVTITGLAKIVGKSRDTILRYERTEIFPPAPMMLGRFRYYPVSLAKRLAPIVAQLPPHKKPEPELLIEINKVFKEEREKYASTEKGD